MVKKKMMDDEITLVLRIHIARVSQSVNQSDRQSARIPFKRFGANKDDG